MMTLHRRGGVTLVCMGVLLVVALFLGGCQTTDGQPYDLGARMAKASQALRDKPATPTVVIVHD